MLQAEAWASAMAPAESWVVPGRTVGEIVGLGYFGTWLFYYVAAHFTYYGMGAAIGVWTRAVRKTPYPSKEEVWNQIKTTERAFPFFTLLPVLTEFVIRQGWTRVFFAVSGPSLAQTLWYVALYWLFIEITVYWIHRSEHMSKFLFLHCHLLHHEVKKIDQLCQWSGLAFDAFDGLAQGAPYLIGTLFLPIPYWVTIVFNILVAWWTLNIHDTVGLRLWPIMGADYHTIHHTHYRYNYGHYTIFADWLWGTLRHPPDAGKTDLAEVFKFTQLPSSAKSTTANSKSASNGAGYRKGSAS